METEAVVAVAGISNVLFSFFCFLILILYFLTALNSYGRSKELALYALSLFIFVLALLTKEPAIMLPFLMILFEICFARISRNTTGQKVMRISGFLLVAVFYLLFRKAMLGVETSSFLGDKGELWLRILSIPKALVNDFQVILFPVNLHYYRCIDILSPLTIPAVCLGLIIWVVAAAIFSLPEQNRYVACFGMGWFLIALLPTLNILPLIVEYSFVFNSEHFLYFPIFGFLLALAIGTKSIFNRISDNKKPAMLLLVLFITFVLMTLTAHQVTYWKNEITLFQRVLRFESKLGRVHILLARTLYQGNQFDAAIKEYELALGIMQGYADSVKNVSAKQFYLNYIKEIHFDLAHCYEAKKDYLAVVAEYQKAIAVDSQDTILYNNLGTVYLRMNNPELAEENFQRAIKLNSKNVQAISNLAIINISRKEFKKAAELLRMAVAMDPNFQEAKRNLETLLKNERF